MNTIRHIPLLLAAALALSLGGCMRWDYGEAEDFSASGRGLFIVNEGNFQYGNASLSYYDPATRGVENEVFRRANAFALGDTAQSMTVRGRQGWVVVNNSHVIFCIDLDTFREVGRITGLTSPRHIHFVSDTKAYVTQLWDNRIYIVDPSRYCITDYIECPDMAVASGSTERMVQWGDYVYVNCWSYQNRILKIDTRTDEIVGSLEVGVQPNSIVLDCNDKLWCITEGGYRGSAQNKERPALCRIDARTFTLERKFPFGEGDEPSEIAIDGAGGMLYWINGDVWAMSVYAANTPSEPVVAARGTKYYGLTVNPSNGDIYVADAVDFRQQGKVYRYSATGELLDEFYAGIIPGAFCWK